MGHGAESDAGVRVEWQIAWFPLDGPDREWTTYDEAEAHRRFRLFRHEGVNPILSCREVTATPWRVVENSVTPPDVSNPAPAPLTTNETREDT